jgi:hypothetical protein
MIRFEGCQVFTERPGASLANPQVVNTGCRLEEDAMSSMS